MICIQAQKFGVGVLGVKGIYYQCPDLFIHFLQEDNYYLVPAVDPLECLTHVFLEWHLDEDLPDVLLHIPLMRCRFLKTACFCHVFFQIYVFPPISLAMINPFLSCKTTMEGESAFRGSTGLLLYIGSFSGTPMLVSCISYLEGWSWYSGVFVYPSFP